MSLNVRRTGIAALVVAAFLATGCGRGGGATPQLTAEQVMERTQTSMGAVKSFRFSLESEGGPTPLPGGFGLSRAEGAAAVPDLLDMTAKALFAGFTVEIRVINAGQSSYMTNPLTGGWQQFPREQSPVSFFSPAAGVNRVLADIDDAALVGDASVEGSAAYHLKGKVPAEALTEIAGSAQAGSVLDVQLWVKKETFHLLQARLDGQIVAGEPPGLVRTLRFANFDEPTGITAPAI